MPAGTIAVNVVANTKKFVDGLTKSRKQLSGFKKESRTAAQAALRFGAAITGAAGVTAGLVAMVKRQTDVLNSLSKLSTRLGVSTQNLEFYRFAADRSGVATRTFEMALQRMIRRVGQAADGMGEAKKTLARFGLDARELVKLNPAMQFELIAKHIAGIKDQGRQLAAAMSFFDSEGVAVVQTIKEDMGALRKDFEALGGAATSEAVKNAVAFTDAMTNLQKGTGAFTRDFVIGITPAALDAVEGLRVIMDNLGITQEQGARAAAQRQRGGGEPGSSIPFGIIGNASILTTPGARKAFAGQLGDAIAFANDPIGFVQAEHARHGFNVIASNLRRGREFFNTFFNRRRGGQSFGVSPLPEAPTPGRSIFQSIGPDTQRFPDLGPRFQLGRIRALEDRRLGEAGAERMSRQRTVEHLRRVEANTRAQLRLQSRQFELLRQRLQNQLEITDSGRL